METPALAVLDEEAALEVDDPELVVEAFVVAEEADLDLVEVPVDVTRDVEAESEEPVLLEELITPVSVVWLGAAPPVIVDPVTVIIAADGEVVLAAA